MRNFAWLLAFLAWLIPTATFAQVGILDLPSASQATTPVVNNTVVWDQSLKRFVYWNGSAYVPAAPPAGNFSATRAPGSTDDNTQGYSVGAIWLNTSTGTAYICTGTATNAAVWSMLDAGSFSLPSIFTSSGSGGNGTLALGLASQSQNLVFASPNGSSGAPTFRSLVTGDLPVADLAHGGTGGNLSSVPGAVAYCTGGGIISLNVPGTSGYPLLSGGSGIPAFNILGLAGGGTGTNLSGLTAGSLLWTNGSTISAMAPGASGTVPYWNGTNWSPAVMPGASTVSANQIYAGPASGIATTPSFRTMVAADVAATVNNYSTAQTDGSGNLLWGNGALTGTVKTTVAAQTAPSAAPSITVTGTAGSTTYAYCIVAVSSAGNYSAMSPIAAVTTGNATLNGTNYNALSWSAVSGAANYWVYRTVANGTPSTWGKIATVSTTSYNDQGAAGDSTMPPFVGGATVTLTANSASIQEFDATTGPVLVTLPDATTCNNKRFRIRKLDATTNVVTIMGASSQTIAQKARKVLSAQNSCVDIDSDASTDWKLSPETAGQPVYVRSLPKTSTSLDYTDTANTNMALLLSNGQLATWGINSFCVPAQGQGANSNILPINPVMFDPATPPPSGTYIVDWEVNGYALYAVLSNGWAYCATNNTSGQAGLGNTSNYGYLKRIDYFVTNSITVNSVASCAEPNNANGSSTLFVCNGGTKVYGVGLNASGNLGTGNSTNQSTPILVFTAPNTAIVRSAYIADTPANLSSYLLLSDGTIRSCGQNANGQLGIGSTTAQTSWQTVSITGSPVITQLIPYGGQNGTSASSHVFAISSTGALYYCGSNNATQAANGNTTQQNSFVAVTISGSPTIVSAGFTGSYLTGAWALDSNGKLYTWGYNGINNGWYANTTTPQGTPTQKLTATVKKAVGAVLPNASDGNNVLFALCSDGLIRWSGATGLAMIPANSQVADSGYGSGAYVLPLPASVSEGTESIVDMYFSLGNAVASGRLYILTNRGNVYGLGENTSSVLTGCLTTPTPSATCGWQKIRVSSL